MTNIDDFYCNQKFWWLTVDLGKLATSSCCSASPHKVNIDWLAQHPGQLFNSPLLQQERIKMLRNQPVDSCGSACWKPESQNFTSRRMVVQGKIRSHENIQADPEIINIVVGDDCNMTCAYCCKYFSTAWRRDVNGKTYNVPTQDDRFVINDRDRILEMLGQKDLARSRSRKLLQEESKALCQSPGMKEVQISGGEPFLYLDLNDLLVDLPSNLKISVYSGLGVDEKRFARQLENLPKQVTLIISAENIGKAYEFVRYGNTWHRFCRNIETIRSLGIQYRFHSTISNITLPGLPDFLEYAGDIAVDLSLCLDPDFLSINVIDDATRLAIKNDDRYPDILRSNLEAPASEKQIACFRTYIREFADRRSLDFSFLPKAMQDWIDL